jgi:hypothetical protein
MNTKQLQLVTYEQAQRLKKLGFNIEVPVQDVYAEDRHNVFVDCETGWVNWNAKKGYISAPTVALALKWIRDEKNIVCHVTTQMKHFRLEYRFLYRLNYAQVKSKSSYYDNDAAENALLDELLTVLEREEEQ